MSLLCSSLETVNNLNQSIDQLHNITTQHCLSERDIMFVKVVIWNMEVIQGRHADDVHIVLYSIHADKEEKTW